MGLWDEGEVVRSVSGDGEEEVNRLGRYWKGCVKRGWGWNLEAIRGVEGRNREVRERARKAENAVDGGGILKLCWWL